MKILVVQESDWLTKGPHQQHHLMDRLSLKSHKIRVIDYEILWRTEGRKQVYSKKKVFNRVSKVHEEASVTLIRPAFLRIPSLDMVSIAFSHMIEISRQIKEFMPDVIIGFGILNNYLAMKLAKKNHIPFICYWIDVCHSLVPYKLFQSLAKAIETKTLKNADAIIAINDKLRDFAVRMGADPKKTYVIRAGVDSDRFSPKIDGFEIRKEYGIERGDLVLFYMGTIFSFSGLKEVALDLARWKDENKNVKLLVVGKARTPELYEELMEIKQRFDLQNNLIFTGRQPYERIPLFVAAADICLLPAYNNEVMRNIVPIKLYEYMVSGKPVISTKLPGVMKEFGHNHGVIYVDRPTGVMKKVHEMINDGVDLSEYGLRARSFVEKYEWDKIVEDFVMILEKIVDDNRK